MDSTHREELGDICVDDMEWMDNLTYVSEAIAVAEREGWPLLGLSVTRRSLNLTAQRYNDEAIQCLTCFICAQQRTTCSGYPVVDLKNDQANQSPPFHTEIRYYTQADFCTVERDFPGTLLNNCSYALWKQRYYGLGRENAKSNTYPWRNKELIEDRPLEEHMQNRERHVSRWVIRMEYLEHEGELFGCTEDICCRAEPDPHADDFTTEPFCRKLCAKCEVPVCQDCWKRLRDHDGESPFRDGGTIPMSICNDHYYGHVHRYIVEKDVSWLECAACCTVWSTMLVYYLEAPFGNLIDVPLGKPEGRTQVKGNLFSFSMPWGRHREMLLRSFSACR